MEGPTPVSSLLHSSTMVVARVWLVIQIGDLILLLGFIYVVVLAFTYTTWVDIKKLIAISTSLHLAMMLLSR